MVEEDGYSIYEKVLSSAQDKQTLEEWRKSPYYDLNLDSEYWDKVRKDLLNDQKRIDYDNESIGDKIKDKANEIENEFLDDYNTNEIQNEILSLKKNGLRGPRGIYKFLVAFRWVINTLFIGIPWSILSIALMAYNIVFNIILNKWWALGNIWLIANSVFCLNQGFLSIPLFFEVGIYLRHFYVFRWISLILAVFYNIVYLDLLFNWIIDTYTLPADILEKIGTFDLILNFFFMYNTILHASIVIINFGIIFKEIEMQFYEITTHVGGKNSEYNLSFEEAKRSFYDDLWFLDPIRIV